MQTAQHSLADYVRSIDEDILAQNMDFGIVDDHVRSIDDDITTTDQSSGMYGAWITPTGEILAVFDCFSHYRVMRSYADTTPLDAILNQGFIRLLFHDEVDVEYAHTPTIDQVDATVEAIRRYVGESWDRGYVDRHGTKTNDRLFERVGNLSEVRRLMLDGKNPSRIAAIRNDAMFI